MTSSKRLISGPPQNFPFGLQNSPLSGLAQVSISAFVIFFVWLHRSTSSTRRALQELWSGLECHGLPLIVAFPWLFPAPISTILISPRTMRPIRCAILRLGACSCGCLYHDAAECRAARSTG
ncbi:hypothetical protein AAWM_00662 [Aspergillus awamori]|uniref:Uncharacterized protein n=1 Tax=Aspergillus awamori TaxID=105351 RepID=A0A401KES4_ASPAW|nr:hypothetical protein AAWM_00662 [Aspergillus awamori]